jgi:hypothetical protein
MHWIQRIFIDFGLDTKGEFEENCTSCTERRERGKAVGSSPGEKKVDPKLEEITRTLSPTITSSEVGGAESQRESREGTREE